MFFFLVIFIFSAVGYCLVRTRDICFFAPDIKTDNEKMIMAAHEVNLCAWPSKMHDIHYNRSQLREYWTLLLAIVSKYIIRDKSDWGNVTLALIAHLLSTFLLYALGSMYLGEKHAVLLSLLYASLMWPYYISIYTGHILLSQAFFLASLFCAAHASQYNQDYLLILAGGLIAISFFSSSASRKYPVLFLLLVGLIFAKDFDYLMQNTELFFLIISVSLVISVFFAIVAKSFLTRMLMQRLNIGGDHESLVSKLSGRILILTPMLFGLSIYAFLSMPEILFRVLLLCFGATIVMMHILLPAKTFFKNIKRYGIWLNVSNWASHFQSYPDPLKTFGHSIKPDFKGGGWIWLHKLLMRMIPELYVLWCIACLLMMLGPALDILELELNGFEIIAVLMISIVPAIVHYTTGGLRVGKAMFSVVLPMLLPISIIIDASQYFELLVLIFVIIQSVRTICLLHFHIIPCRLSATILREQLQTLNIKKFYSFDTMFNESFLKTMLYSFPDTFEVEYIKRISQIESGYLVVPPTSAKSVSMETQKEAIIYGDFAKDPELDRLISSTKIENIAVARIPTIGASKYFAQESEVTSYLDLMLKRISKVDYYRGNAWIVEIK